MDSVLQLTKQDIRGNFEAAQDLMRTRAEVLAPSTRDTHPKRARSLNIARLLALPANWELAISAGLGEVKLNDSSTYLAINTM